MTQKKKRKTKPTSSQPVYDPELFGNKKFGSVLQNFLLGVVAFWHDHLHLLIESPYHNHRRLHERRATSLNGLPTVLRFESYQGLKHYHAGLEIGTLCVASFLIVFFVERGGF